MTVVDNAVLEKRWYTIKPSHRERINFIKIAYRKKTKQI